MDDVLAFAKQADLTLTLEEQTGSRLVTPCLHLGRRWRFSTQKLAGRC
jgi:hypothetical protein